MWPSAIKPSRLATLAALSLWAAMGFAAREEHVFEVWVTIPTLDFYVLPVDPGFLEREQQMNWNPVLERLEPLRASFDVASSTKLIAARLAHEPVLFSGRDTIGLKVTFNNKVLDLTSSQVINTIEAWPGTRVPLLIEAVTPVGGFVQGQYYGSVHIIFENQLVGGAMDISVSP